MENNKGLEDIPMLDESLKERKRLEAEMNNRYGGDLKKAIEVLCNALREDTSEGSYYHSWMCSIKMTMYDAMRNNGNIKDFNQEIILNMCEDGAKNFLNLLISK